MHISLDDINKEVNLYWKKIKIKRLKKKLDKRNIFQKVFGYCPYCPKGKGWFKYPNIYRQNTMYVNDDKNYIFCCNDCFKFTEELWEERWNDHNSERL